MSQRPGDSLVYLPLEDWTKLQEAFKCDWPRSISGYTVLETQRKWINDGFDYGLKVFCPFDNAWNGMVAVNVKERFFNEIIIQCPKDDTNKLEEALKTTKKIDWTRKIMIPFAPNHIIECIKNIVNNVDVDIELILPSECFLLEKENQKFENICFPDGTTLGLLTEDHIGMIDSSWPHRYPGSTTYFQLLISTNSGFGLFKQNNLISWVFINESGNLGHMYTLKEHRRQGYAMLLLKLICNKLLEEGKDVIAYAVKNNEGACKLYRQMGFKNFGDGVAWCYLKPMKRQ